MCSITEESSSGPISAKSSSFSPLLMGSIAALALALGWRAIPGVATVLNLFGLFALSIVGFIVSTILFVNFYTNKNLRKACPTPHHVAELRKEILPKNGLADLETIANPEGLNALWKQEIQANNKELSVLLTGVTGYVGRAFLFQLLREIATAEKEGKKPGHKVYVMARAKARRNLSAAQRLEMIRDEPMFAPYKELWDEIVVAAESGDLQEENCGMKEETLKQLKEAQISHVVHCAADVNFNRPLPDSAAINISPALQLQALASQWPTCKRFVHCSTAFVNPGPGTDEKPMPESLFDLGDYDPQDLYDSMRGDQKLALKVKEEFGFPNNYVLTKCVAEHLVTRHNKSENIELKVVRPAIVGPAWILPYQGWNGEKPSTISGVYLLWACRVIRMAPLTRNKPMPVIPVDVAAAAIIHAMIAPPAEKTTKEGEQAFPVSYRNLIWSHKSPNKFIDGIEMARENIQCCQMMNHFSAIESAISLLLLDIVDRYPSTFDALHTVFNLGPLYLLQFVCWILKTLRIRSILHKVPLVKLFNFSEILTLYRPYMGVEYKFESSMNVPDSLDVHRYSAGLYVATKGFMDKMFPDIEIPSLDVVDFLPKRLDLLWALMHPCRSLIDRITMYFACKILHCLCQSMLLDFTSIDQVSCLMRDLEKEISEKKTFVVLAPNHNSVFDFVLIKYITFYMASMGLDVPTVLADQEFSDLALSKKLAQVRSSSSRHPTLAAFFEGSPSTTDQVKINSGALEKLRSSGGDCDFVLLPLSMKYKSISESEVVLQAAKNGSDFGFFDMFSLYWQICVLKNAKASSLGDIIVRFGKPFKVNATSSVKNVATDLQNELQSMSP